VPRVRRELMELSNKIFSYSVLVMELKTVFCCGISEMTLLDLLQATVKYEVRQLNIND
jgi:hypothetical protein